jgi:hypothetical protein
MTVFVTAWCKDGVVLAADREAHIQAYAGSTLGLFGHLRFWEDLRFRASTRHFREIYAYILAALLVGQLLVIDGIFLAVGMGWLQYEVGPLRVFVSATIAQVVALGMVIVHHFFPTQH